MDAIDEGDVRCFTQGALRAHPDATGQLITVLNAVQERYRYVPQAALQVLSEEYGTPVEELEGFCSAFGGLSSEPVGRYVIEVCDGTACHAAGSAKLISALEKELGIAESETTPDGFVTLRAVHCVGACSQAPVVAEAGRLYGHVAPSKAKALVNTLMVEVGSDE